MTHPARSIPLVLAGMLALLVGCGQDPAPAEADRALALVGDETITVGEFEAEMRERNRRRPGYYASQERREELLQEMIEWRALLAEARSAGVMDDPEFRSLVERMTVQRLRQDRLEAAMAEDRIDEDAIRDYYETNIDEFSRPERRRIAMIRIDRPSEADGAEQARMRIEQAREQALALPSETRHFGEVAVAFSSDRTSRYQGGVIGWLVDDPDRGYQWPEAVLEAAFELDEPGQISPVVTTGAGYFLVRLVEREGARTRPLEQVADGIRHRLDRHRARELEAGLVDQIRQAHPVEIDEQRLAGIEPPEATLPEREAPRESRRPPAMPAEPDNESDES